VGEPWCSVYGGLLAAPGGASSSRGFIPTQDQGYLLVNVRCPTLFGQRTGDVIARLEPHPNRFRASRAMSGKVVSDERQRLELQFVFVILDVFRGGTPRRRR
jgi:hypothetical protein